MLKKMLTSVWGLFTFYVHGLGWAIKMAYEVIQSLWVVLVVLGALAFYQFDVYTSIGSWVLAFLGEPSSDNVATIAALGAIVMFLLIWLFLAFVIYPYWKYKRVNDTLDAIRGDESVLDWTARQTAEFVMQTFNSDLSAATEFVRQMAREGRITIRAIENGKLIDEPIKSELFQTHELYLIGTSDQYHLAMMFQGEDFYHDDGWISSRMPWNKSPLDRPPYYLSPKFSSIQVKSLANSYVKSRGTEAQV